MFHIYSIFENATNSGTIEKKIVMDFPHWSNQINSEFILDIGCFEIINSELFNGNLGITIKYIELPIHFRKQKYWSNFIKDLFVNHPKLEIIKMENIQNQDLEIKMKNSNKWMCSNADNKDYVLFRRNINLNNFEIF